MKKLLTLVLVLVFLSPGCGKPPITEKDVPIIPRDLILGNSETIAPKISPDGTKVAWISGYTENTYCILVAPVENIGSAKPVVYPLERCPRYFVWDYTNNLLYSQDENGDENNHIYRADITTRKTVDLTPGKGFMAFVRAMSVHYVNEIAISMNDRNSEYFDTKLVNLKTGKQTMIYQNNDKIDAELDENLNVRIGTRQTQDGGMELLRFTDGKWETMDKVGIEDSKTTGILAIDRTSRFAYIKYSAGRDTLGVYKVDLATWSKELVAADDKSEAQDWIFASSKCEIAAVAFDYDRKHWNVVDPDFRRDISYLSGLYDADFTVNSMSLDDGKWVVEYIRDNYPEQFYVYDRKARKINYLFGLRRSLEKTPLAKMYPEIVKSRDGLDLVCYLSLPPWTDDNRDGVPNQPLPMVLVVHGGPASRVSWGFDSLHQFFANRGYAVLSVNFRGSLGFGKKFLNLGNGEWGGKMQNDLIDAVDWAIEQKIAIPAKVAIYGGSYGGYATLAGMTFTPDKFACGIDLVGISNLSTFLKSIPPYWKPYYESQKIQVGGDPDTKVGKVFLDSRSPINFVDMIKKPLLIGHGANDPRVKVAESEQIVASMKKKSIPVIFCYYPDEGHGFSRWQNYQSFFAVVESFLAKNLGGRCEEITSATLEDSTLEVKEGIDLIEGLDKLVPKKIEKPLGKRDK